MKLTRIIFVLAALGVTVSAQPTSQSIADGRYFNLVDAAQNRKDLSDAELAALAKDDLMLKQPGAAAAGQKLTQDGLEAAAVHLCGSNEEDVIVIGDGAPFATKYAGPFWIIRNLPAGPVVVLGETSLSLSLDTKRSNKCLNVEAFAVTATDGITTDYKFDGQKYVQSKQKSVTLSQ